MDAVACLIACDINMIAIELLRCMASICSLHEDNAMLCCCGAMQPCSIVAHGAPVMQWVVHSYPYPFISASTHAPDHECCWLMSAFWCQQDDGWQLPLHGWQFPLHGWQRCMVAWSQLSRSAMAEPHFMSHHVTHVAVSRGAIVS